MIFKTFKKLTHVPCPCIIVLEILHDLERPYETLQDHERPCETVYTTAHEVHSTSELNRVNIVYKTYEIELEQKSVGLYVNPVSVHLID